MNLSAMLSAVFSGTKPVLQYKAVHVLETGFHRLFVFHCRGQDESRMAGGLLGLNLDYWDGDITKAARVVLERGSARFQANISIVEDWQDAVGQYDYVPDKEQYVLDYLETLWRLLPDTAIVETRYFCPEGGAA